MKNALDPAEFIQPLYINGLNGRLLSLPAPKSRKREILVLYGSHSSIERMYSLAQELNKYGSVTLPDWPGFGGMDSLFKIGEKPTIDAMADYLAAFVTMRYKRRRFTIVGMSYGFNVAVRMLQKYPKLAKQVDMTVSIAGFVHADDFHVPKRSLFLMKYGSRICKNWFMSQLANAIIRRPTIWATYTLMAKRHSKMKDASPEERNKRIDFEVTLWRINDLRTYFFTAYSMFTLDLCQNQVKDVPVYHVAIGDDQFFNNNLVEQHLHVIFNDVTIVPAKLNAHMPTVIATPEEVAPFFPAKLRRVLSRA